MVPHATTPTSPAREVVRIDGLAVELSGPRDAPAVLFGHSLLCNRTMFAAQVAALEADHRCVNIDFRGHGESDRPPRGFSMHDQAHDYHKVVEHLGLGKVTIVGLSMGAMAAMHFALAHPARVSALVLMNSSAEVEPPKSRAKDMALAVTARLFGVGPFILKQVAPLMFGARFRAESPDAVAAALAPMAQLDRAGLYRAVLMVLNRPAVGPRLAEVRAPTLVITGDDDKATPPALGQRIAETIPGAELRLLPRTGHLSTIEEPEVTSKLIRAFVAKVSARP